MKRILIFNLLFFIILYTFGQQKALHSKIQWESPKSISHYYQIYQKNLNKTEFLFFENANYYDQGNMLPYYYELLPVPSSNTKINITNIKWEPLSVKELEILKNNNEIENEVNFNYTIQYIRKKPFAQINILPLRKNAYTGRLEKILEFDIEFTSDPELKQNKNLQSSSFTTESILKNGKWIKIRIQANGIYQLSYNKLVEMGFANPANIKVYGNSFEMLPVSNSEVIPDNLLQNAIYFEKGSDGIFNQGDFILFYAKGPDQFNYDISTDFYSLTKHCYSDYNYFFLTTDVGTIKTINTLSNPTGMSIENKTTFTHFAHYEKETVNLIESGQLWFGEHFDISTIYNIDFQIANLIKSTPIKAKIALVARSSSNSTFTITSGSQTIANPVVPSVNMSSYTSTFANRIISEGNFTSISDNFKIQLAYNKPTSSSEGWLDFITLNAERLIKISENQLVFNYFNPNVSNQIIEFEIQNTNAGTRVWDITDPSNAGNISLSPINGSSVKIKVNVTPGLNEFIAFNNSNYLTPEIVGDVANQNLHALNHRDMIIVTHPDFISQANEIADLHIKNDNLSVAVVTPNQVYNEFSSGTPDASAIRNFARMIYDRPTSSDTLKYLLFIGDGSFDHKSITANNINYILTYQSKNSLNPTTSFVTDDFFGLLDPTDNVENSNSGLVDIGIGRLPVKSSSEAQNILNKIKTYINAENRGDWINSICFVGDDEDNNLHMLDADRLASFVDTIYPYFFVKKIYLDAFPQVSSSISESYPEVNRLINDEINNGVLIFNYTGHGGEDGLAHERIISIDNINSWKNSTKLSIFMTATCEFSRFDNHKYTSAGELVLLNPNGGSIALFSTTRLVYSSPNYTLNRNFYNYVFEKDIKGNNRAFGDIIRLAKNASGTENNKRNFTLLGDPAIKMHIAEYNIVTDSVNHNIATITDTLKALSRVTIHGHIADNSKSPISNYNGIVYPLVLDKKRAITTLGNDGGTPMNFEVQNNILYKGKASVINGKFKFSFVVPKDISYNFDNGKISYYSSSSDADAKGYFENFIIGGSNNNAIVDNIGPQIKLYMNDENFVSGGVTNESPTFFAVLNDSSGINTVGNGIGHDIIVTLDNNTSDPIVLNDYYESNMDDYQKGKIEYLFSKLEDGDHTLKLKVWDVYNNSSEENLDFTVAESASLAIKNLFNYPNPFTEQTAFYFDHNRPNEDLEILIQIFTISGKLVKTISQIINSNAFRSDPIHWDGEDDFGDHIGRGVYIYQIKVRTIDGETVKKTEKLVILK